MRINKTYQKKVSSKKESNLLKQLLSIHGHRYFRGALIIILVLHMLLLVFPWMEIKIPASKTTQNLFAFAAKIWPFPTFKMFSMGSLYVKQILMKSLEISVILLYTADLVPKIFIWRQGILWRLINILIVTLMVAQLPETLIIFDEFALPADHVKLRVFSISLSFVVLCEILSIREQRSLRLRQISIKDKNSYINLDQNEEEQLKEYSWCEIVKHDKQGDCWIVISGLVYDVTDFVKFHPGGPMIYDGAGGDCTALWHSYHRTYITRQPPPQKYLIGLVRDYVSFYSYENKFYDELKEKVEQQIPRSLWQNDSKLFMKAIVLIPLYFITFYWYISQCTALSAIIFGFVLAQIGVNIMHDGNHAAFSSNKWLSIIAGYTLDLTFSTSVVYRRSHNFGHHGCVNHYELDRSFDTTYPLMRLHPLQPRLPIHKYQHIYIWLVYGLANFGDLLGTFDELQWMSNFPTRRGYVTNVQVLLQVMVKILFFTLTMILPSYYHGWFNIFPIWVLYMMSHSYGYALFFAVNHWTTESGIVDNSNIGQINWGALQVINSSNFQTKSTFWTNICGALNYQIEHHLFPQLAHTRLPQIQNIVKEVCQKYKIRYYDFPTFFDALKSHYNLLKHLGQSDDFPRTFQIIEKD